MTPLPKAFCFFIFFTTKINLKQIKMTVKQLKEILNEVDENLEVLVYDKEDILHNIDELNVGEVTFQGACDEQGNLIPDSNDKKYDVKSFMIQLK